MSVVISAASDLGSRTENFPARTDRPRQTGRNPIGRQTVDLVLEGGGAIFSTMQTSHDELRLNDPDVERRSVFVDTFASDDRLRHRRGTQRGLFESGRAAAESFPALRALCEDRSPAR